MTGDHYYNSLIASQITLQTPELLRFGQEPARPLSMEIASPPLLEALQFFTETGYGQPLASNEVEVKIEAIGLDFVGAMIALGYVAANYMGVECAGVVTREGLSVDLEAGGCVSGPFGTVTFQRWKSHLPLVFPPFGA